MSEATRSYANEYAWHASYALADDACNAFYVSQDFEVQKNPIFLCDMMMHLEKMHVHVVAEDNHVADHKF